jgi:putative flippase GtrA
MSQKVFEPKGIFALFNPTGSPVGRQPLSGELSRYLVVRASALAVDLGLLTLLTALFAVPYLAANAIAFTLAALVAYWGSVHWAFKNRKIASQKLELALFIAIGLGGLLLNEVTLWLGVEVAALSLLVAKIGAAVTSFAFNFTVRKIVLFST